MVESMSELACDPYRLGVRRPSFFPSVCGARCDVGRNQIVRLPKCKFFILPIEFRY